MKSAIMIRDRYFHIVTLAPGMEGYDNVSMRSIQCWYLRRGRPNDIVALIDM